MFIRRLHYIRTSFFKYMTLTSLFYRLSSLTVMLLVGASLFAQGTIRGFVKDEETGQPVIFILVGLEGTAFGTQTDENG